MSSIGIVALGYLTRVLLVLGELEAAPLTRLNVHRNMSVGISTSTLVPKGHITKPVEVPACSFANSRERAAIRLQSYMILQGHGVNSRRNLTQWIELLDFHNFPSPLA